MITKTNQKRIFLYLAFSFGISWATGLVIYRFGGLEYSPTYLVGGAEISLAYILLATGYMFGPAAANLLTRLITHEGTSLLDLRPYFDHHRWRYFLIAWFLPGFCVITGLFYFSCYFPNILIQNLVS